MGGRDEYGRIVEQRAVGIQQLTLEVKLLAVGNSTVKAKRAAEAEAREFGILFSSGAMGGGWERSGYKLFFGIKYNYPGLRKILNYERIIQVNLKKRLLNQPKMSKIITCKVNLTSKCDYL